MKPTSALILAVFVLMAASLLYTASAQQGPPAARQSTGTPFTAKDLAMLDRVSSPRSSPDGRHLAYVVRRTDWERNGGTHALELLDLHRPDAAPVSLLEDDPGFPSPEWSADGTWLYFLSMQTGSSQIWKTTPDGSRQEQVTAFPVSVAGFRIAPDHGWLLVSVNAHSSCDSLGCIVQMDERDSRRTGSGIVIESGPPRFGASYEDDRHLGIFRADLAGNEMLTEARRIVRGFEVDLSVGSADLVFSPDGGTIYFTSLDPAREKGSESSRNLYSAPSDGSSEPEALLGELGNSISNPALSPDGRTLAYLATRGSLWTFGRTTVRLRDMVSGSDRELTPGTDILFRQIAWAADGRTLYATALEQGQGPLYEIDVQSGQLTKVIGEGTVDDVNVAGERVVYLHDSFGAPQQVFERSDSGVDRQLTRTGVDILADRRLSEWEQFSFPGWNDERVHGFIMKPYGHVEGQRYPVAFLIHGGPQQSFSNTWSWRWNPQIWAGVGYAVVLIDFHGSTGYGEAFGLASVGHWGDRPLEDLRKGWSFLTSNYAFLDESRACALGGSYGGFMVNWMASQWNAPWRCFVNHAGIFDTRFSDLSTTIDAFFHAQFGGASAPADLDHFNPALQADKWRTPMLVTHGTSDFLVSIEQGISSYNAARRQGVPAQMLVFPDEGHLILKPQNLVQWYAIMEAWLGRWTGEADQARREASARR